MQTTATVERDLAETLRAMAAQNTGEARARRLKLAEDADRGAQAAARHAERLQQRARWWAQHADVAALDKALEHAGQVLADLARTESDIADTLARLASRDSSDLDARRRQLAAQASAAARHARHRAQALHQLAASDAAMMQPEGTPAADPGGSPPQLASAEHSRLTKTGPRLAEPHQARLGRPGDDPPPQAGWDARRAHHYRQQSAAHLPRMRRLTVDALGRAARAHDRAAQAHERSARAGIGDVAEHKRRAEFHWAAARADRRQAQEIGDQAVAPAQEPPKVTAV